MQDPPKDFDPQQTPADLISPPEKLPWHTPSVTEISRFDILDLGPVPGPEESATYYLKSE